MPSPIDRQPRIAFADQSKDGWTAGTYYLQNLFAALRSLDVDMQPEIILLQSRSAASQTNAFISCVDRVLPEPPALPRPNLWRRQCIRVGKRLGIWREPEPSLSVYLRELGVDVLFSRGAFGSRFGVPLLSWIPDFQHQHLPEMFSPEEIEKRDRGFSQVADYASRVILSSRSALQDFAAFAPHAADRARVLPFVAQVPAEIYASDPAWICDHYHLPRRFIYLPNQFWKHKNHGVVVDALGLVKARYPEVVVVCTGNTNDSRDPLYFSRLLTKVAAADLRTSLIILGLVPRDHLFILMRQSLAILQPSLFEGWSTTVEEAKSVGKGMIISDIPVHREQDPPRSIFFDPHDPEALADCLDAAFEEGVPGPDHDLEAKARANLAERSRAFGQAFLEIVQEVIWA